MHKHNLTHNSHPTEPKNDEIARLAYSFFETEGRIDGHDLEHWLRAREQLSRSRSAEDKAKKKTGREHTLTSNDGKLESISASPPSGQREEHYARVPAAR